jgi:acyl-CoA thioesterase
MSRWRKFTRKKAVENISMQRQSTQLSKKINSNNEEKENVKKIEFKTLEKINYDNSEKENIKKTETLKKINLDDNIKKKTEIIKEIIKKTEINSNQEIQIKEKKKVEILSQNLNNNHDKKEMSSERKVRKIRIV